MSTVSSQQRADILGEYEAWKEEEAMAGRPDITLTAYLAHLELAASAERIAGAIEFIDGGPYSRRRTPDGKITEEYDWQAMLVGVRDILDGTRALPLVWEIA